MHVCAKHVFDVSRIHTYIRTYISSAFFFVVTISVGLAQARSNYYYAKLVNYTVCTQLLDISFLSTGYSVWKCCHYQPTRENQPFLPHHISTE